MAEQSGKLTLQEFGDLSPVAHPPPRPRDTAAAGKTDHAPTWEVLRQHWHSAGLQKFHTDIEAKDVVLVLGERGSGKTTTIHHILQNPDTASGRPEPQWKANRPQGSAIGKTAVSRIAIPTIWKSEHIPEVILEFPGFEVSYNEAQDLANAMCINQLVHKVNSLKVVLIHNMLLGVSGFIFIVDTLFAMLADCNNLHESITVVFTQGSSVGTSEDVTIKLTSELNGNENLKFRNSQFLEYILKNFHHTCIFSNSKNTEENDDNCIPNIMNTIKGTRRMERAGLISVAPIIAGKAKIFIFDYVQNRKWQTVFRKVLTKCTEELKSNLENIFYSNIFDNQTKICKILSYKKSIIAMQEEKLNLTDALTHLHVIFPNISELGKERDVYFHLAFLSLTKSVLCLDPEGMISTDLVGLLDTLVDLCKRREMEVLEKCELIRIKEENEILMGKLKESEIIITNLRNLNDMLMEQHKESEKIITNLRVNKFRLPIRNNNYFQDKPW